MDVPLRLAVDFDGVLHDTTNVLPGYKLGKPIKKAIESLQELKRDGAIIVIHSVWGDTTVRQEAMSKWLRYFNIPYDFITNIKPDVDVYIDDKGYRFENWSDTLDYIKRLRPEK